MSKIKQLKIKDNGSHIDEKKIKKKLNKRQRQLKNKLKHNIKIKDNKTLKINNNQITDLLSKKPNRILEKQTNNNINNNNNNINSSISSKKRKFSEVHNENESKEKIVKIVLDTRNPENISANWKQLKNLLADKNKENSKHGQKRSKKSISSSLPSNKNNSNTGKIWSKDNVYLSAKLQDKSTQKMTVHNTSNMGKKSLVKENSSTSLTKTVAIDCEMVGGGLKGECDILARVSIVNIFGNVLYDKYVKPQEEIQNFRTKYSGIRPKDLEHGIPFSVAQKEVSKMIENKIVVGHGLSNDFKCLLLSHQKSMIRDTCRYKPFVKANRGATPGLKKLTEKYLDIKIQTGEHDSVQDAQAAMRLYTMHKREWEEDLRTKRSGRHKDKKKMIGVYHPILDEDK